MSNAKESHLDPRDEEEMWCSVCRCDSGECEDEFAHEDDWVDYKTKAKEEQADFEFDWWNE